jgi:hypothetical protein
MGSFQVLKGYIPNDWTSRQEAFYRRQRKSTNYYTGEQWTKERIEFFWTHSNILWKDRCAAAHAPGRRQPRQLQRSLPTGGTTTSETAYAHAPLMLAHDRRVLDVPLEERLQNELLNYWRRRKPCYPLSTEASATHEHNYTPVIKTSAVISPKQQWPLRTTQQPFRQQRARLVLTCSSWTFGSAFRAHEPGKPRFPLIFASTSQASPTTQPKSIGYRTTITYTN